MKFNISAGHNPDGMIASGAIGLVKESTEARKIKDRVISLLIDNGHIAYDSTCDNGTSVLDVLQRVCVKSNVHKVDFDVSIHLNSYQKDYIGDGKQMGTEVLILNNSSSKLNTIAWQVCNSVCKLGFKNRGVKSRPDLYFLKNTNALALLIECFFLDDKDDVDVYDTEKMAVAIVEGLLGNVIVNSPVVDSRPSSVNIGDTVSIITPYKRYIADDVQTKYGIVQIRENVLAGGVNAFDWQDNGIPEECVDLTDNEGYKRSDSDYTHPKKGDYFNFPKSFTVIKRVTNRDKVYLQLDFNNNQKYRFWVIEERCKKV